MKNSADLVGFYLPRPSASVDNTLFDQQDSFRYGIQSDDDCIYCGEKDTINHTFSDCAFVNKVSHEDLSWFNDTNKTHFNLSIEVKLFGVTSEQFGKKCNKEI